MQHLVHGFGGSSSDARRSMPSHSASSSSPRPLAARNVGARSRELTSAAETDPGCVTPGQDTSIGVRIPPSYRVYFEPSSGVLRPSLQREPPLSVRYTTIVFSA